MAPRTTPLSLGASVLGALALLAAPGVAADDLFGPPQVISSSVVSPISVHAADLDGDNDLDVLSASWFDDSIRWFENTDGLGTFGPENVITNNADRAYSVHAADIDGDDDLDVISGSFADAKVAWYENLDGRGTFGPQQVITNTAVGVWSVRAADLDGDGDPDIVSASDSIDEIAWYRNLDGQGTFSAPIVLSTTADGAVNVFVADLDGDLDNDILSASSLDDTVEWFRNTDGLGNFTGPLTITTNADGVRSVHAEDIDGDNDLDVLSASGFAGTIEWYENTDGLGDFGAPQIITPAAAAARTVWAADLDGDDDVDVLSASNQDDKVAWYENIDGQGTFGPQQIIDGLADGAFAVRAFDLDHDGDLDVLAGVELLTTVGWYENGFSAWANLGQSTAGVSGPPLLVPSGDLTPSSVIGLPLTDAAPFASATLVFGVSQLDAPFKGGVMVPNPLLFFTVTTDSEGAFPLSAFWPPGAPSGLQIYAQWWIVDAAGPVGFSASNGVRGTVP